MARRVLLHIGTPKTATTYLQDVLFRNSDVLARHGVHYPAERFDAHFRAGLDLIRREWGGLEDEVVGDWDALSATARSLDGTVIVSNEILAGATAEQAARARASFGDAEVHLVLTVRDLARQIPAEWQETVKHYNKETYAEFLQIIMSREGRSADLFWRVQDVPDILDRWVGDLPPQHVHLVTVPLSGAPHDVLLSRLLDVFGLGEVPLAYESDRTNASLGVPETAMIRLVNERVVRGPDIEYAHFIREMLAHRQLADRTRRVGSPRLVLPPDLQPWADGVVDDWITRLSAGGYAVTGDLAELKGGVLEGHVVPTYVDPDAADQREMLSSAVESIVALLYEGSRFMVAERDLHREVRRLRDELAAERAIPLASRIKGRVAARLDGTAPGRTALAGYRRLRGRSSREA
ncbi:hypothetical protein [Nocardioides sp. AN3]